MTTKGQGIEVAQDRLGAIFGLSLNAMRTARADGAPHKIVGRQVLFNTSDFYQFQINQATARAIRLNPGKGLSSLDTERGRLARMQADRIETELATTHGQLLPFDKVASSWEDRTMAFRAKMLAIPAKMARVLSAIDDHREIASVLKEEVVEALSELVREELERIANEPIEADDTGGEAAAEADALPVGKSKPISKRRGHSRARKVPKRKSPVPSRSDGRGKRSGNRDRGGDVLDPAFKNHPV